MLQGYINYVSVINIIRPELKRCHPSSLYVCRSFTKCTAIFCEQTAGPRSANFCTRAYSQCSLASQFPSKLSTSLTFVFKVKYSKRVLLKVYMWLYGKQWQTWQILTLTTHWKSHVAFQLAYLHLILAHFKGQCQGHAHFEWEYLGNGNR